jgi:GntR family transcriptional regulator
VAHEHHAPARFAAPPEGLDASSGVALYAQLAELWRYNIVSRKWPSGHRLDNFDKLAAQYKVARITVRQAVARLVQEGLLSTQRGRGTFVLAPRGDPARERPRVGVDAQPDHLAIEILYNRPSAELPSEFRGAFGAFDRYREITKLHRVGRLPFAMVRAFVAEPIYQRFTARAIEHKKLLRLTFQHAPRAAEHMHQRMTIELADLVVSQHLACTVGAPVAKILRQTYGADQRLSYAGISWYRGDAFEMDMTLPRGLVVDSPAALIAPAVRTKRARHL